MWSRKRRRAARPINRLYPYQRIDRLRTVITIACLHRSKRPFASLLEASDRGDVYRISVANFETITARQSGSSSTWQSPLCVVQRHSNTCIPHHHTLATSTHLPRHSFATFDILDDSHTRETSGPTSSSTKKKSKTKTTQATTLTEVSSPKMKSSSSSSVLRRAMTSIALVAFVVLAVFTFMPVGVNAEVDKDNDFGTVIGIDLGTTYSCVAYVER